MSSVHIYALVDPRAPAIFRYVGKTTRSLGKRLSRHVFESRHEGESTHKCRWVRSLVRDGVRPQIVLLETVDSSEWEAAERRHIAKHRATLTNATDGGDGCVGLSEEARAKISSARRGLPIGEEHRRKLSEANRGKTLSDEVKQKISAAGKGKRRSDETRARIAAAKTGTRLSPETLAKVTAAARRRPPRAHTAESKAKIGAATRKRFELLRQLDSSDT